MRTSELTKKRTSNVQHHGDVKEVSHLLGTSVRVLALFKEICGMKQ